MADLRRLVNSQMSALIDGQYGCLDAAVEAINARSGQGVCKGTLSKRLACQFGWPVDDVIALEDACARHPVTRLMARRMSGGAETAGGSMLLHAGAIAAEAGDAVNAILAAQQSQAAHDGAQAVAEIDEAIEALRRARGVVMAQGGAK